MSRLHKALIPFVAAVVVFYVLPQSAAANPLLEKTLVKPIIEGKEAAGVKLGDSERDVMNIMGGWPGHIEHYGELERTLSYGNMTDEGGVAINIFMKKGNVIGIEIISRQSGSKEHIYKGTTKKGFMFGQSVSRILALYGNPDRVFPGKVYWYKKAGILFEQLGWDDRAADNIVPNAIVIVAPDSDIIPHLRRRGGYE